jgi:hypothetical protein
MFDLLYDVAILLEADCRRPLTMAEDTPLALVDIPYTDADDITTGVACFMCAGEKYQGRSWHALYLHIIRKHTDVKPEQLVGSYLHKKARREKNASQKRNYSIEKRAWRRENSLILEKLESLVHPQCKVAIPNLTIRKRFVDWRTTPEAEAKLRKNVPIPVDKTAFPMPVFEAYVCAFGLTDSEHIFLAVRRFLHMLEIETDIIEFDLIGVQVAAYQQGVLAQLLSLPIMHPTYSWAQKIVKGLGWLIDQLSIRCGQERLMEEKRILELIEPELFAPYERRVAKAQHAAANAKSIFDRRLLEDFAPVAVVKRIVYEAMLDLGALALATKSKKDLTPSERHAGTTSFVMVLYGNGFAGRSGDWEKLTACAARRSLQEGRNYIECVEHKTAGHYGEVGKGLFDGIRIRYVSISISLGSCSAPPGHSRTSSGGLRPFPHPTPGK